MKTVTLVEFRKNAARVLGRVRRGERLVLTSRGRPAARLEPITEKDVAPEDPIYRLAESAGEGGKSLSNRDMDRLIYGA